MPEKDLTVYFITIGVMIVVVVAVGIAIYILRGRLFGDDQQAESDTGGVLETMRAMRDRGQIAEEEYRAAQAAIVAKAMRRKEAAQARAPGPRTVPEMLPQTDGTRRAPPGYDLTGAPLPRPAKNQNPRHEHDERP